MESDPERPHTEGEGNVQKYMSGNTCMFEQKNRLNRSLIYGFLAQFLKFFYSFFNNLSSLTCSFGPTLYPHPTSKTRDLCETVDVMCQAENEVGLYLVSTLFLLENFTRA